MLIKLIFFSILIEAISGLGLLQGLAILQEENSQLVTDAVTEAQPVSQTGSLQPGPDIVSSQKHPPNSQQLSGQAQDDMYKTLSRSKASLWVDTNQGNIFSTSLGSSHLERKDGNGVNSNASGVAKNMLLTLLIQPETHQPVTAGQSGGSNLKPILLLLQRQQDVNEMILEKEEKIEKMNVHLQQQIKQQHILILELLEQIKMFLEIIKSPGSVSASPSSNSKRIDDLKRKMALQNNNQGTSSSSVANAVVMAAKNPESVSTTEQSANSEGSPSSVIAEENKKQDSDMDKIKSDTKLPPMVLPKRDKLGLDKYNKKNILAESSNEVKGVLAR